MTGQTTDTTSDFEKKQSNPEKTGWRLGLACYLLFLVFVLSAGANSILRQVYGSGSLSSASPATESRCAREIPLLQREIVGHAGEIIKESHPAWLISWDRRFEALGDNCGKYELARFDLKSLRDTVESTFLDFGRKQARIVKRIERELDN